MTGSRQRTQHFTICSFSTQNPTFYQKKEDRKFHIINTNYNLSTQITTMKPDQLNNWFQARTQDLKKVRIKLE